MAWRTLFFGAAMTAAASASAQMQTPPPIPTSPRVSVPNNVNGTPVVLGRGQYVGSAAVKAINNRPVASITSAERLFANSRRYQYNYQLVQQYGRCASDLASDRVRALLAAAPNTTTETIELRQLSGVARSCLPSGFGAPVIFLRGGLAEAMYNRLPAGAINRPGLVNQANVSAFRTASLKEGKARLIDDRRYTLLADCLVLQSPIAVEQVLRSRHGSREELKGLNGALAGSPGCSNVARFPSAGGRAFLRSYLAESAYRWANFRPVGREVSAG